MSSKGTFSSCTLLFFPPCFVTTNVYQQGVICGTCSEKSHVEILWFFPARHHDWYVHIFPSCLKWHLHQRSSTMNLQRESHPSKQAPQTIRSYLFGLARDHLALAITTHVVAWLGWFFGLGKPQKSWVRSTKKNNEETGSKKHGIQPDETWDSTDEKTVFRSDVSFTKSILYCPFLRGFPSLSKSAFGVAWLETHQGLKLRFATFMII